MRIVVICVVILLLVSCSSIRANVTVFSKFSPNDIHGKQIAILPDTPPPQATVREKIPVWTTKRSAVKIERVRTEDRFTFLLLYVAEVPRFLDS